MFMKSGICCSNELIEHLAAWLCCAADNPMVDYYLCQCCENAWLVLGLAGADNFSCAEAPQLMKRIDRAGLLMAFRRLAPEQKLVLHLKMVKGVSDADVARRLSRPVGVVKNIQQRALFTLLHLLDFDCELIVR